MISKELYDYAEEHSTPEYPFLAELNRETNLTQVYPRMLAGICRELCYVYQSDDQSARILEIGNFRLFRN